MNIKNAMLTKNPCYNTNRKLTANKKLMLHSVGCPQPNASVFVKNWNNSTFDSACVHAFIDATTGDVYQTLPWDHRGWHAGGSANNTHIGVEMCEPDCIKYTGGSTFKVLDKERALKQVRTAYNSAVELFAYLCKKYNIDPMKGIASHKEGHALGIASNHGDPEHLWKGVGSGYTMDGFRKDVKAKLNGKKDATATTKPSSSTTKVNAYKVKVNVADLRIRKGPGTNYDWNGKYTGKGVFTIVEESKGEGASKWGLLKTYAGKRDGWISLNYAKRV